MGIFKISLFLDFQPSLRLTPPFVLIIITNTFSIISQTTPINANIEGTISSNNTSSHPPQPHRETNATPKESPFRGSVAVFVGFLAILVCFTFLILLYAKHCRGAVGLDNNNISVVSPGIERHNSGVARTVVESLPLFRFQSLKGQKDGLECAVCLNKFEPTEVLRLLPKCKHAFHIECLDTWLDIHSTCPLCRYRVHPEDILLINSSRNDSSSSSLSRNRVLSGILKSPASSCSSPPPPPLIPSHRGGLSRIHSRHSSAGETGTSSSLLEVIVEKPSLPKRKSTTSLIRSQRSLDSRSSFNKKISGGVYKLTPSRLSYTRSLDSGGTSDDAKRKDGLLLDGRTNSPSSLLSNRIQENGDKPPTPTPPRQGEGGEGGGGGGGEIGSPSLLKNQIVNTPFLLSKRSLDGSKSFNKPPNNTHIPTPSRLSSARSLDGISQLPDDSRRKDGLLLLAEKNLQNDETAGEHHRLDHQIILAGPDVESSEEQESSSDVQSSGTLYLQTDEMILSDDSRRFSELKVSKSSVLRQEIKNSDDMKVNDDRSVSEITGLSRFRSNEEQQRFNDRRQSNYAGGAVARWKAWMSATKQKPSSPGVDASPSPSTASSNVI